MQSIDGGEEARDLAGHARALIHENYASPNGCGTSFIARELGVSASLLCHRYRSAFGATIGQEIRRLRIERACEVLDTAPKRLIKEVAAEVGYQRSSYRTFLNAFRSETGMSPSDYRRGARRRRLAAAVAAEQHRRTA